MIAYEEALRLLQKAAAEMGRLSEEETPLSAARGRVCSRQVSAVEALPPFDNSAMDGYAVKAAETRGAPVLRVIGSIAAGDAPAGAASGGVYEIMTGGPMPAGFDAVVPLENVTLAEDGRAVRIDEAASAGDYVRPRGRDFQAGAPILEAGTLLEPRHILALAALGVEKVSVRRRPLVSLIATGKELVGPGEKPGPGQIRNSTTPYLAGALEEAGARVSCRGCVGDDPALFKARMKEALAEKPDLILTTGAVSTGRYDFVADAVRELGAELVYHKTATRPGKPGLVARFPGGPLFFGLPGNPLSTVVGLRFFVMPVLRALLGMPQERPRRLPLAAEVAKPAGLRCFFKASASDGAVRALSGQASFQIRPLLQADCWLVLPEAGELAAQGALVDVYPL